MVRPTQFSIEQSAGGDGRCKLAIAGELDISSSSQVEDEVNRALADGATSVEIHLSDVSFIDSTGLRTFLQLNQRAESDGWRLRLASLSEPVTTLLEVTGLGEELSITDDDASS